MAHDGRSFMAKQIGPNVETRFGEQVTGPLFSLWEDALDPRTIATPFDVEGTPKKRVTLVEKGVARGVVHDRQSAKWFETTSTGHAASSGATSRQPLPIALPMTRRTMARMMP